MGVMRCFRKSCDNIICNRHSNEHGYICWECFDELCETGPTTDIETFMNTSKRTVNKQAANARYNVEFSVNGT